MSEWPAKPISSRSICVPEPAATGLAIGVLNRIGSAIERAVAPARGRTHEARQRAG